MGINIGLESASREKVAKILARVLADEFVLYVKTLRFHWNVTGMEFAALHKMLEAQYEQLSDSVDAVAERMRALGHTVGASMTEFLKTAELSESTGKNPNAKGMLAALLDDHEAIVRALRKDIDLVQDKAHDAGTADFLTGLMEQHEKTAWMLRAHLE